MFFKGMSDNCISSGRRFWCLAVIYSCSSLHDGQVELMDKKPQVQYLIWAQRRGDASDFLDLLCSSAPIKSSIKYNRPDAFEVAVL